MPRYCLETKLSRRLAEREEQRMLACSGDQNNTVAGIGRGSVPDSTFPSSVYVAHVPAERPPAPGKSSTDRSSVPGQRTGRGALPWTRTCGRSQWMLLMNWAWSEEQAGLGRR